MVLGDDEIERSHAEDTKKRSKAEREALQEAKNRKIIAQAAARAKKANDARAYAQCLRLLRIVENSPEWKNAWEFFYRGQL
jgi:hypothetical protein